MTTPAHLHQSLRLSPDLYDELRAIAVELTQRAAGTPIGMPTVLRLCVERGLPVLQAELGQADTLRAFRDACQVIPPVHPSVFRYLGPKGKP